LVGIAAAPDFTEDSIWASLDSTARERLVAEGAIAMPSDYGEEPYPITWRLIEDGRNQLVLREPLELPFPVRLLQGSADADVLLPVPLQLLAHADCPDLRLTIVKGADHRFSGLAELDFIDRTVEEILEAGSRAQPAR
jgi:pimeloyl-ACP methyl ester carboxylesterase